MSYLSKRLGYRDDFIIKKNGIYTSFQVTASIIKKTSQHEIYSLQLIQDNYEIIQMINVIIS